MRSKGLLGLLFTGAIVGLGGSLILPPEAAARNTPPGITEIHFNSESLDEALIELFGTSDSAGLLGEDRPFEFKAEHLVLSSTQLQELFSSEAAGNLKSLASALGDRPGTEVKFAGLLDGSPFEAKFEAGEIKLEGLQLSQSELDALVDQLKTITGVREVKAQAIVDGKPVEVKIENGTSRIRTDDDAARGERHRNRGRGRDDSIGDDRSGSDDRHGRSGRLDDVRREDRVERSGRSERPERPERAERTERSERPERIERVEKSERTERTERPERVDNSGSGRR